MTDSDVSMRLQLTPTPTPEQWRAALVVVDALEDIVYSNDCGGDLLERAASAVEDFGDAMEGGVT